LFEQTTRQYTLFDTGASVNRYVWIIAAVAGLAAIVVGLSDGQWDVVLRWGQTLCTSCIGLGH